MTRTATHTEAAEEAATMQHNPTTDQKAAIIARLLDAYATVALCERMAAVAQEARA